MGDTSTNTVSGALLPCCPPAGRRRLLGLKKASRRTVYVTALLVTGQRHIITAKKKTLLSVAFLTGCLHKAEYNFNQQRLNAV